MRGELPQIRNEVLLPAKCSYGEREQVFCQVRVFEGKSSIAMKDELIRKQRAFPNRLLSLMEL